MAKTEKIKNIRIQKAVYRGFGLGYLYGKPVFTLHAFPDEKIIAKVRRKGRKAFRGEMVEVIESPCPHRIQPPCPHSGICGGCHYQELAYEYQLQLKREILEETLTYIGKVESYPPITINPSPQTFRYRPQCGFQVQTWENRLKLGYFRFESQDFIPIDDCLLLRPDIIDRIPLIESFLNEHIDLLPNLIYIDFRVKSDGTQLVLTFGFRDDYPDTGDRIFALAPQHIPGLSGILFRGWKTELLIGQGDVEEKVENNTFVIGAGSFFQNNIYQWAPIQQLIQQKLNIQPDDILLDLFCGVGLWSVGVGKNCSYVMGYENNERSVELAGANAERNGLSNYYFEVRDLSQGLGSLPKDPTVIIINPPRSGCSRKLMNAIAQIQAHSIIYISCDPPSLSRDIARLCRKGNYTISSIDFIDMFPQTFSIETAVLLTPESQYHSSDSLRS
ncbi:23S rRNA (uracil(1939)-C(5))-methyltransferase RlmD [candidate division CSSED10-310 bacterium]|uniref:23S rRNA (Uracil(1939)-C(5))-methyltransferase RlmD n=1 Tax=candidate division CSSED10-310 bacterium TaxID=2855610 RepID=A0ABV6YYY6_UNCC1